MWKFISGLPGDNIITETLPMGSESMSVNRMLSRPLL